MNQRSIIRQCYSVVLALVFLTAITPRPVLHDLFTNHSHRYVNLDGQEEAAVGKVGFGCDCNKIDALSPFIAGSTDVIVIRARFAAVSADVYKDQVASVFSCTTPSRGPPAIASLRA